MSDEAKQPPSASMLSGMVGAAVGLAAAVAGIYLILSEPGNRDAAPTAPAPTPPAAGRELARGAMTAFVVKAQQQVVPDIAFLDGAGRQRAISQWRGRVVLVNLWATWCAPCRKEMPALANLQRRLGGDQFEVVAISVDRKGAEASAQFLAETGATGLALYVDRSAKVLDELQARGLPATLLVDREGREIGRLLGPAEWDSEDAVRLIEHAIGKHRGQTS